MKKKELTIEQQYEAAGFKEQPNSGTASSTTWVHQSAPVRVLIEYDTDADPINQHDTGFEELAIPHRYDREGTIDDYVREHLGCPDKYVGDLYFYNKYSDDDGTVYVFNLWGEGEGFTGKDGRKLWKKAAAFTRAFVKGTWRDWLDGNVYGFIVEVLGESVDSCWGFYGLEYCLEDALAEAKNRVALYSLPDRLKIETPEGSVLLNSEADFQNWCSLLHDESGECAGRPKKYPCVAWVVVTGDVLFHPAFVYPILRK